MTKDDKIKRQKARILELEDSIQFWIEENKNLNKRIEILRECIEVQLRIIEIKENIINLLDYQRAVNNFQSPGMPKKRMIANKTRLQVIAGGKQERG